MRNVFLFISCLFALTIIVGCGVSQKALDDAEQRIKKLSDKGVPDSLLSQSRVLLYQARDAKERGNFGIAEKAADSMFIHIAKAEEQYKKSMERLKPFVESQRQTIRSESAQLTGLQKKASDSLAGIIDSFISKGWLLQAEDHIKKYSQYLPQLKFDEERAKELRPRVTGTWECTNITKHSQDKTVHAVEKKIFSFKKDGTGSFIERKKGKSSPGFKEDWEFVSTGSYDLKGDTIHLLVDRFKRVRQDIWELKENSKGKKEWIKNSAEPYDSLITDESQNRYILFEDLKKDFVKK